MKKWQDYIKHDKRILGTRKVFDNNIYTFDIETSSVVFLDGIQYNASDYENMTKDEQERAEFYSFMYIWMLGINDVVYYGRTWDELKTFLELINKNVPEKKYLFIHNASFEFQFFKSYLHVDNVLARKSHKVMTCDLPDYNFTVRCSYYMSNCALKNLPDLYMLDFEKMVGDLDYDLIRHNKTQLTDKELKYCENDCLVVYQYIKRMCETYEDVKHIPITSTGQVRRELKEITMTDYKYKSKVRKSINVDPHVYNLLIEAFAGGYTHANWIYADEILENVDSFDFTSSYPYVLVTHKYPSTSFKRCNLKNVNDMLDDFAYIFVIKFKNISCKYYNNFISESKCRDISKGKFDNGRIISADEIIICVTDIDLKIILDTYRYDEIEILESWFSKYDYLPKKFINFVLDKYVNKTRYKGVVGKELAYQKEKNKFNALYGMSVTNEIRDNVLYDDILGWREEELSNEEIEEKLHEEYKKGFLSFSYGVWVTAYARNNLIRNIIKLDEYVIYCDTDSIKLKQGYNKKVIDDYNKFVERKIKFVSNKLNIPIEKFAPKDIKGQNRMLGVFDFDGHYEKFITQGAKKYAVITKKKIDKIKDSNGNFIDEVNVIKIEDNFAYCIEITVAGVPKKGCKALKTLEDFKDNLVFTYKDTGKNLLIYLDDQSEKDICDYKGKFQHITDKSGCAIIPTTYVLGKSQEYAELISDESSKRAIYKEVKN